MTVPEILFSQVPSSTFFSLHTFSMGDSTHSQCFTYPSYTGCSQLISGQGICPKLQTHVHTCLLYISTQTPNRHLKLNMPQTGIVPSLIPTLVPACQYTCSSMSFPISLSGTASCPTDSAFPCPIHLCQSSLSH